MATKGCSCEYAFLIAANRAVEFTMIVWHNGIQLVILSVCNSFSTHCLLTNSPVTSDPALPTCPTETSLFLLLQSPDSSLHHCSPMSHYLFGNFQLIVYGSIPGITLVTCFFPISFWTSFFCLLPAICYSSASACALHHLLLC